MTRKDVQTTHEAVSCDVCGRTLLRGEHPEAYLAGGSRRQVCELCTARATHQGWIRESASLEVGSRQGGNGERRALRGRLLTRRAWTRARRGEGEQASPAEPAPQQAAGAADADRHVHAVPTNGELKAARAIDLFNASRHPRTVAGVARSLGAPVVAVRPNAEPSMVTIVVAWELCWYRYEVDLADGPSAVRVEGQGYELTDLAEADREQNAAASDDGALALLMA